MHTYFTSVGILLERQKTSFQINHSFRGIDTGRQETMKFNLRPTKNPSYGHWNALVPSLSYHMENGALKIPYLKNEYTISVAMHNLSCFSVQT